MRGAPSRRGQALIEAAITVVLFVGILMALMTFAHAFMVANMITHAARDGARIAAVWDRGVCGTLQDTGPIEARVKSEIRAVTGEDLDVAVSKDDRTPNGSGCGAVPPTPTVHVRVTGCVGYVFPVIPSLLGTPCPSGRVGFHVDRTVVFYDERSNDAT